MLVVVAERCLGLVKSVLNGGLASPQLIRRDVCVHRSAQKVRQFTLNTYIRVQTVDGIKRIFVLLI